MDARRFDLLTRAVSRLTTRRHLLGAASAFPVLAATSDAEGRKRKFVYCLNGKTFRAKMHKKQRLMAKGAIPGKCSACARRCRDGCCIEGRCRPGSDWFACGTGGQPCAECGLWDTCQAGVCSCTPACEGKRCGEADGCGGRCEGPCADGEYCCSGHCATCPCTHIRRDNGTCARLCPNASECGGGGCWCSAVERVCGSDLSQRACPDGDYDCPRGEFCWPVVNLCTTAC